ncbi:MAG: sigma-54 dependent transcriptional regulator [Desulfobacterales bacterium]|jgi:two-component system, NtrC family, response regulator AtoC
MLPPIIGISKSIEKVRELIHHVADTGLNIVITGESGVGKEVVAQNLCYHSPRKDKPFVKINCAALPEGLLESELFGYERGAFTGAEQRRRGKFELAHGGVLFLDEIGDMPLILQGKLLHVLQSGEFSPLGSEKDLKTDTWIIAATNHELEQDIRKGAFREDLYYRLNIIKIYIPPLRERPEDIPPLIDYYIERYTAQFHNKPLLKPSSRIVERLTEYSWPGNVRELQNVLKRALVLGDWEEVVAELAKNRALLTCNKPDFVAGTPPEKSKGISDLVELNGENRPDLASLALKKIKKKALENIERRVISYVLEQTGWNRTKASKILKISYKTLLYKISDLNIEPPADVKSELN